MKLTDSEYPNWLKMMAKIYSKPNVIQFECFSTTNTFQGVSNETHWYGIFDL